MFKIVSVAVDYLAPIFLILSPLTSYSDQILSIHRTKTSAGFSLDIPLIMLTASIMKVFYWFGAHYSTALFLQALLMIVVQIVLLKVALDNRPNVGAKNGLEHTPFSNYDDEGLFGRRPYDFWQWKSSKPYFQAMAYLTLSLLALQILLPEPIFTPYTSLLGYIGLGIEAFLPVPQILSNHRARSCKGFRLSVLVNWLIGDAMKMSYLFLSTEKITWAFRGCGLFQAMCDCYLGVQYWMFGEGGNGRSLHSQSRRGGTEMTEKLSNGIRS